MYIASENLKTWADLVDPPAVPENYRYGTVINYSIPN